MSRTLAPPNPRSCTTRRPSVSIFSRCDGLLTNPIWTFVLRSSRKSVIQRGDRRGSSGRRISNFHQLLAEILAGKQPHERSWGMLEADRDVLFLHEFAFAMPPAERLEGLGLTRGIIKPGESLHAAASCNKVRIIRGARLRLGGVGFRYRATQHDPSLEVDACEYLVKDGAANVVEEDVDPIGTKGRKSSAEVLALVVDSCVEVRFVDEPIAFFFAARRTDHAAAFDLGYLASYRTRGASGTRHHDCVGGFDLANLCYPEIRC